jgi:septum formation inhibitor-activating ATPase MinD
VDAGAREKGGCGVNKRLSAEVKQAVENAGLDLRMVDREIGLRRAQVALGAELEGLRQRLAALVRFRDGKGGAA